MREMKRSAPKRDGVVILDAGEYLFVMGVKGLELVLLGVIGEVTERSCLDERFKR